MIEKSIAIKMAKNIKDHCKKFTSTLGCERASQLAQEHSFFHLKRKIDKPATVKNKIYNLLTQAYGATLDASYAKHSLRQQ